MSAALSIITAGPGVTLQDAGRRGYLRYGVTAAGPMDRLAMATANLAVGAPEGATAIEVSLGGIELTGGYPAACSVMSLIYILGMALIWLAPETKGRPLPE